MGAGVVYSLPYRAFTSQKAFRFGESAELVGAAGYLASPRAASFVTGSILRVDGGYTAMTI